MHTSPNNNISPIIEYHLPTFFLPSKLVTGIPQTYDSKYLTGKTCTYVVWDFHVWNSPLCICRCHIGTTYNLEVHPKLHNINFHNVTHSLISQTPRERMCVVQIKALHWVPIPMPMGFGWAYYCSWVDMGSILLCIPASNSKSESNFSDAWNTLTS